MKQKLEELNFDVLYVNNAMRTDMYDIINRFLKVADLYSVILVYYAGHGIQIDGENYFVPVDCIYNPIKAIFIGTLLVGTNTITDYINNHPKKVNIMILDACRSNPGFFRDVVGAGLAEIKAGSGTLIAFATAPNKNAYGAETELVNGCYTECLLKHITQPNIKIENMFKRVRKDVVKLTGGQHIPWESTSLNSDFHFNIMTKDEIEEKIYYAVRNNYKAEILIILSKFYEYTGLDIMQIYERQKVKDRVELI